MTLTTQDLFDWNSVRGKPLVLKQTAQR